MGGCCCASDGSGAEAHCPRCGQPGEAVAAITPAHTLKSQFRQQVDSAGDYRFCASANCPVVYFRVDHEQSFTAEQLIHRVSCKDDADETPLCYCFKISKADGMEAIRRGQPESIIDTIQEKMRKGCFCDRANPRGRCCLNEVEGWLSSHTPLC